jgi:hypothetical protein
MIYIYMDQFSHSTATLLLLVYTVHTVLNTSAHGTDQDRDVKEGNQQAKWDISMNSVVRCSGFFFLLLLL